MESISLLNVNLNQLKAVVAPLPPAVKQMILEHILQNKELLAQYTSCIGFTKGLLELFTDNNNDPNNEEMIYSQLMEQKIILELCDTVGAFSSLYELFIRQQTEDKKTKRLPELLTVLAQSQAFQQIERNTNFLIGIAEDYPELHDHLIKWAETTGLMNDVNRPELLQDFSELREKQALKAAQTNVSQTEESSAIITQDKKEAYLSELKRFSHPNYLFDENQDRGSYSKITRFRNWKGLLFARESIDESLLKYSTFTYGDWVAKQIDQLIAQGANCNARDEDGNTPVINAAKNGNTQLLEKLFSAGGNVNVKNTAGYMPKQFNINYDCDHDFDEGDCRELKFISDKPNRKFLAGLERIEAEYLNPESNHFNFKEIEQRLLEFISEYNHTNVQNVTYMYILGHTDKEQKSLVDKFFHEHAQKLFAEPSVKQKIV